MLTTPEKDMLCCLKYLHRYNESIYLGKIEAYCRLEKQLVLHALKNLISKSLVVSRSNSYLLTKSGFCRATEILKQESCKRWNRTLLSLEKSEAYSRYSELVYNNNYFQFNMVCKEQLRFIVSLLSEKQFNNILDLGCGLGYLTEYFAEKTKAKVTGVDIACDVISNAKKRNIKNTNINFEQLDLDDQLTFDLKGKPFDLIISFDSLYFSADLDKTIYHLKELLSPSGHLFAFWTTILDNTYVPTTPDATKIAIALRNNEFEYSAIDFTTYEIKHWKRCKKALRALKAEFSNTDDHQVYEHRHFETNSSLRLAEEGRLLRFLYTATAA